MLVHLERIVPKVHRAQDSTIKMTEALTHQPVERACHFRVAASAVGIDAVPIIGDGWPLQADTDAHAVLGGVPPQRERTAVRTRQSPCRPATVRRHAGSR